VEGCDKLTVRQGKSVRCNAHGGGRRCSTDGCTKLTSRNTDNCIAHGGGKRCTHPGCSKSALDQVQFCMRHGGGTRCCMEGCRALAATGGGGLALCKPHRVGKVCAVQGCTKHIASLLSTLCKGHELLGTGQQLLPSSATAVAAAVVVPELPLGSLTSALTSVLTDGSLSASAAAAHRIKYEPV